MDDYYVQQAGSGIGGFGGVRYQKGNGFFGRIISGGILPLLQKVMPLLKEKVFPYVKSKVVNTGKDIMSDIKDSIKGNLKKTATEVASDALEKIKGKMSGEGIKRRKRRRKISSTNTRKKIKALNLLKRPVKKTKRKATKKKKSVTKRKTKKVAVDFL